MASCINLVQQSQEEGQHVAASVPKPAATEPVAPLVQTAAHSLLQQSQEQGQHAASCSSLVQESQEEGQHVASSVPKASAIEPVAPLALEINAECSAGVSGREELSQLLSDLSSAAAVQLELRGACEMASVGLRITTESLEEWCGFRDVKRTGHHAESRQIMAAKSVLDHLEALFQNASRSLPLSDTGAGNDGCGILRRISVQLCLQAGTEAIATRDCSTKVCRRHRRSWPSGSLNVAHDLSNESGRLAGVHSAADSPRRCNEARHSPRLTQQHSDDTSMVDDLASQTGVECVPPSASSDLQSDFRAQPTSSEQHAVAASVEDLCSPATISSKAAASADGHSDSIMAMQVVQNARSSGSAIGATSLVEQVRHCCARGCRNPSTVRRCLHMTAAAARLPGFQDLAAALWALLERREHDVVVTALRVLRSSMAGTSGTYMEGKDANELQASRAALYFNVLLRELNRCFAASTHGSIIGIAPLPEC